MIAVAIAIGLGVGLVLGGLGGGGSVLTVPALVFLLGEPPHNAATASLVIVGTSALIGLFARARDGQVRWISGLGFGAIGIAGSVGGTMLGRGLDPNILLLAFAAVILLAALVVYRGGIGVASAGRFSPGARPAVIAIAGGLTGLATGLFGVGGGFLIVPALVALGWPMPIASGTSLLVIVINSAASLSVRVATEPLDWKVIIPVTLASIIGTLLGKVASGRISGTSLSSGLAALLVIVAAYTATRAVIGSR